MRSLADLDNSKGSVHFMARTPKRNPNSKKAVDNTPCEDMPKPGDGGRWRDDGDGNSMVILVLAVEKG